MKKLIRLYFDDLEIVYHLEYLDFFLEQEKIQSNSIWNGKIKVSKKIINEIYFSGLLH